jgi:hypothetical protein
MARRRVPPSSAEGLIRQIPGGREYVQGVFPGGLFNRMICQAWCASSRRSPLDAVLDMNHTMLTPISQDPGHHAGAQEPRLSPVLQSLPDAFIDLNILPACLQARRQCLAHRHATG